MATTEGHRLLRKWLSDTGTTQRVLAARVGRSEPAVSFWFSGSRPDGDARAELYRLIGIPFDAWSERPKKNGKRKAA